MIKLKDIAEEAGVALSTVSATLNGTGRVSKERRAEITALADKMGYRPCGIVNQKRLVKN